MVRLWVACSRAARRFLRTLFSRDRTWKTSSKLLLVLWNECRRVTHHTANGTQNALSCMPLIFEWTVITFNSSHKEKGCLSIPFNRKLPGTCCAPFQGGPGSQPPIKGSRIKGWQTALRIFPQTCKIYCMLFFKFCCGSNRISPASVDILSLGWRPQAVILWRIEEWSHNPSNSWDKHQFFLPKRHQCL